MLGCVHYWTEKYCIVIICIHWHYSVSCNHFCNVRKAICAWCLVGLESNGALASLLHMCLCLWFLLVPSAASAPALRHNEHHSDGTPGHHRQLYKGAVEQESGKDLSASWIQYVLLRIKHFLILILKIICVRTWRCSDQRIRRLQLESILNGQNPE